MDITITTTTNNHPDGDGGGENLNSATSSKNPDELGLQSTKDLVWAKAYPYTWWPGWVKQRKPRGKLLVSFFESTRALWVREHEISSFEGDFEVMMSRKVGSRLQTAIESALSEFSRRLVAEMSCGCVKEGERREGAGSVAVLEFVKGMAVCGGSHEEMEAVGIHRAAAEVEVFRRYAFVKRDLVYEEAMRVAEMVGDSEGKKMSTSIKDEIACSLIQETEVKDEEEQEYDGELEKKHDIHKEYVGQVKRGTAICKNKIKKSLDVQHPTERSQVFAHQTFHPAEVLAFVRRLAVSFGGNCVDTDAVTKADTLVNTFRQYGFTKHDWIYQETMRLSESTNTLEANMNGTAFEDEQPCKVAQEGKVSEDETNQELAVEHVKHDLLISKTIIENPLLDIVKNLHCLALDPFSGAKGRGVKHFDATRQQILRYRELVYLKALRRPLLLEHNFIHDSVVETGKAQKLLKVNSTRSPGNISVNVPAEENIVVNKNKTQKFQHLPNARSQHNKKAKVGDAQLSSNNSNNGDAVKSVDRDVKLVGGTASCNGECENNRRQKTKEIRVCSNISDAIESVDISSRQRDNAGRKCVSERNKNMKTNNANVCSKSDVESGNVGPVICSTPVPSSVNKRQKTDDAEVYCKIANLECSDVVDQLRETSKGNKDFQRKKRQKISTFDPTVSHLQGSITKTLHVDKPACANADCHELKISSNALNDQLHSKSCNETGIDGRAVVKIDCGQHTVLSTHPGKTMPEENEGVVADVYKQKPNIGIASGGSAKGNQRPSKTTVDISVKTHQTKTSQPMSGLFSSPLSAKSPASTGAQVQSAKSRTGSEYPATLHMKFPKDFKLPSKDELVERFLTFGPIDPLKSKVFFYTGSAQVVFLNHLDAEAACHYAKKKKIFSSGVNVRFWLDQREHLKREANDISSPVSLPMTSSSLLDVKSCLKISSPQTTKSGRKNLHVKFPSASRDQPSCIIETKDKVSMQSDSVKCSKEAAPDISQQMFALLKKCEKIVAEVKDDLGCHSYYSLFTHSGCFTKFNDQ